MESIAGDLRTMARIPLEPGHVALLRETGTEHYFAAGEIVAEADTPMDSFIYVVEGELEIIDSYSGERLLASTLGPNQFSGDLALLGGGNWTLSARAAKDTRALIVNRTDLLHLMATIPEMSDIILTVLMVRRRRQ